MAIFPRPNLDKGKPGRVVHAHVHVLPANPLNSRPAVSVYSMADASDVAQLLDVDVDQVACVIELVALINRWPLDGRESVEAETLENSDDRRTSHADPQGDLPGEDPSVAPQGDDQGFKRGRRAPRAAPWRRTPVFERSMAALAEPPDPLIDRLPAYAIPTGHGRDRLSGLHGGDDFCPNKRRSPGPRVHNQGGSDLVRSGFEHRPLRGQPSVNNLSSLYSKPDSSATPWRARRRARRSRRRGRRRSRRAARPR